MAFPLTNVFWHAGRQFTTNISTRGVLWHFAFCPPRTPLGRTFLQTSWWWPDAVVSALASINEVNQRRAPLVLRWVTKNWPYPGSIPGAGHLSRCVASHAWSTQPGHPFVGRRNEYQPKGGDALRLGSKDRYFRVWVAGKTVWSPRYTRAISEHFSSGASHYKALYKSPDYSYPSQLGKTPSPFPRLLLSTASASRLGAFGVSNLLPTSTFALSDVPSGSALTGNGTCRRTKTD